MDSAELSQSVYELKSITVSQRTLIVFSDLGIELTVTSVGSGVAEYDYRGLYALD